MIGTVMSESIFLQALQGKKTERAPIWIMRQAGRYLPQYRAIRSKTTFLGLCKTPELAAEVTLQPIEYLGVDAAIIFSDILIVPEAMGQGLSIEEKVGPRLFPIIQTQSDVDKLQLPPPEKAYDYLGNALRLVKKQLPENIPLIGFAGSPFTLMAYMVEGQGTREFKLVKKLIYENPKLAHQLLKKVTQAVIQLLNFQVECGAQTLQIFDSWGGVLSSEDFKEFSLQYVEEVIAGISNKNIPIIFFAKGTSQYLERIKSCGAQGISLDWTVDLNWARKILGEEITIQGNLDPLVLLTNPDTIREKVKQVLAQIDPKQSYIFNLGHGIVPEVPPENAKYLVECVKELSAL